jgi:O-methyltransferase domain
MMELNPSHIMQVGIGFWPSKTLLSAVELGLFTQLGDGSACQALPPGGAFVAIENLIDDARRENVAGLMSSLNMLIETGDGFEFTAADFAGWCGEVGFTKTEILPLAGPASAAVAIK